MKKTLAGLVLAVLAVAIGSGSVLLRANEYRDPRRSEKDFAIDYAAVRAWRAGGDPFPADSDEMVNRYLDASGPVDLKQQGAPPYWHPPIRLLTMLPLEPLPYEVAGVVWLLFSALCFVGAAILFGSELGFAPLASGLVGAAALAIPSVQSDLAWGQVNTQLLLLLVLSWRSLRRNRQTAAGIGLGIATAVKVVPGFLALSLLAERRLRALSSAVLTAALTTVLAFVAVGFHRIPDVLRHAGAYGTYGTASFNVSIEGQIGFWFGEGPGLVMLAISLTAATVLVLLRKPRLTAEPLLAAVLPMLLSWPVVWDHYLTLALPWFVIAFMRTGDRGRVAVAIAFLLCCGGVQSVGGGKGSFLATMGLALAAFIEFGPITEWFTLKRSGPRPITVPG